MDKKTALWALIFSVLFLCVAASYYWFAFLDRRHTQIVAEIPAALRIERSTAQEPITPIPLVMNLDQRKVALGRRLFHDPQLSHDNTIACASCHRLDHGGTDGLPVPIGIGGKRGNINTLTVFNSGFNFRLFWDGRTATLEDQIDFPLQHPTEMASSWPEVIAKLSNDATYRRDFAELYVHGITQQSIKDTIATYERSLTTPNSKFDRYLRGDIRAMSDEELEGYQLFKNLGCINCHQGMNVGGNQYQKLGVINDYFKARGNVTEVDYGLYNVTKIEADRYKFRVAPLRNVALTAPYFHDASADTLEKAVLTMGRYQLGISLSRDEIISIVKFLKTLTGEYSAGEYQGDPAP